MGGVVVDLLPRTFSNKLMNTNAPVSLQGATTSGNSGGPALIEAAPIEDGGAQEPRFDDEPREAREAYDEESSSDSSSEKSNKSTTSKNVAIVPAAAVVVALEQKRESGQQQSQRQRQRRRRWPERAPSDRGGGLQIQL